MSAMDVFWILFMLAALQPIVRQKLLDSTRYRKIAAIEKERRSRVIILVHRQETMRFLGVPLFRYIDINDSEQVIRAIRMTDDDVPIDLVLHTPGGLVLASFQIARALKEHPAKVTVFVPFYAMSGGTLLALAADEIVLCQHSLLGPVDPQLGQIPAASVLRVLDRKPIEDIDDQTVMLADQAEKAISQVGQGVRELLEGRYDPRVVENIADTLSTGFFTHDHGITSDVARELGLHVSDEMPAAIFELMDLFPQGQSSVEYLPGRRFRMPAGEARLPRSGPPRLPGH